MKDPNSQYVGKLGEDIAVKYLQTKEFAIISRNYRKKYGEIDIVASKNNILHFIEVKSVSREKNKNNVSCETDAHRPEDNVHSAKLKRLARTIQTYLSEVSKNQVWVFDLITVKIDVAQRKAHVSYVENLII